MTFGGSIGVYELLSYVHNRCAPLRNQPFRVSNSRSLRVSTTTYDIGRAYTRKSCCLIISVGFNPCGRWSGPSSCVRHRPAAMHTPRPCPLLQMPPAHQRGRPRSGAPADQIRMFRVLRITGSGQSSHVIMPDATTRLRMVNPECSVHRSR